MSVPSILERLFLNPDARGKDIKRRAAQGQRELPVNLAFQPVPKEASVYMRLLFADLPDAEPWATRRFSLTGFALFVENLVEMRAKLLAGLHPSASWRVIGPGKRALKRKRVFKSRYAPWLDGA